MADDDLLIRAAIRDEVSGPLRGIREEIAATGRAADTTYHSASNLGSRGFDSMARGATTALKALGRLARYGLTAVTVAAGAALYEIAKLGASYEQSLNTFQSVSRASGAEMDKVRKKAKALGADMRLPAASAADAADALTELAKGGLSVKESIDASLGTMQLSAAANISAADAANIQVAALNQYGLAAGKAGKVADYLAATANATAASLPDVATALSYVGPVADATGISLGETTTAIGLLAKGGIVSEKAGTSLRGMLSSLAHPSSMAAKGLRQLGIDAYDAQGNFKGMRYVTDALAQAQGNLTTQQFNSASVMAFGRESLAGVATLAKAGADGYDSMAKATGRSGAAQQVAEARTKGLSGAFEGLKSQLETAAISAYELVKGPLEDLTRGLADRIPNATHTTIKWLRRAGHAAQDAKDAFTAGHDQQAGGIVAGLFGGGSGAAKIVTRVIKVLRSAGRVVTGVIIPAFHDAGAVLPVFLSPLGLLIKLLEWASNNTEAAKNALEDIIIAFTLAKAATMAYNGYQAAASVVSKIYKAGLIEQAAAEGVAAETQWSLNAALTANPVGLVVVALAALAAGLILAYKHSQTFRDIVHQLGDWLGWLWDHALKPLGEYIGEKFVGYLKLMGKIWLTVWYYVVKIFGIVVDKVLDYLGEIIHGAAEAFGWIPDIGDKLKAADEAFTTFHDKVSTGFAATADAINGAKDALDNLGKTTATPTISYRVSGAQQAKVFDQLGAGGGAYGDTATAHGSGNFAATMAAHARYASPGVKITNALTGGGGRGAGSGDHQAGRALDLVGPNLSRYAAAVRRDGGFAQFHGAGDGRHLHAVPAGDTPTSHARTGGGGAYVAAGAVTVNVNGSGLDAGTLEAVTRRAVTTALREAVERRHG